MQVVLNFPRTLFLNLCIVGSKCSVSTEESYTCEGKFLQLIGDPWTRGKDGNPLGVETRLTQASKQI